MIASSQFLCHGLSERLGQDGLRLRDHQRGVHTICRAGVSMPEVAGGHGLGTHGVDLLQLVDRLVVQIRLVNQAAAHVGVVVGAVEALLEAPIQQFGGSRIALHGLKAQQRGVHIFIGNQRPLPRFFQPQKTLGKIVGVAVADKEAAVVTQYVDDLRLGIPRHRVPNELVRRRRCIPPNTNRTRKNRANSGGRCWRTPPAADRSDSLPSVSEKATSQSGTGNWHSSVWVMSGYRRMG